MRQAAPTAIPVSRNLPRVGSFQERLYYAAGIIDGEGFIGMTPNGSSYALRISVGMTTMPAVYLLEQLFGGNLYFKEINDGIRKAQGLWYTQKTEIVRACLLQIHDKLLVKAAQAKLGLEYFEAVPRYSEDHELRQAFYQRFKELNK